MIYGIDVVVIGPAAVRTPIWGKAEAVDLSAYEKSDYGPYLDKVRKFMSSRGSQGLAPEVIGELAVKVFASASPKARYAVVAGKLANWIIPQLLPRRTLDRVIARRLGIPKAK